MTIQRESLMIANPFKLYAKHKGWHCENTHGNQYQEGFPDCYMMHGNYEPRWVEFKVIESNGSIHLSRAQERKFPIWIAHGVRIWLIAGKDFRGEAGLSSLEKAYRKLFGPSNAGFYLLPSNRRLYI